MNYIFKFLLLATLLFSSTHAGFWSSLTAGVAANSLTSSDGDKNRIVDAKSDEKKIQQALSKLGFYDAKIDGNLNSFETRSAIESFEKRYRGEPTGTLEQKTKEDILYLHDLFKNYKSEFENPGQKESNKLLALYKAFDKLEDKLIADKASFFEKMKLKITPFDYLSNRLKTEITQRRAALEKIKLYEEKWAQKGAFADVETKLIWQDNAQSKEVKKPWILNERDSRSTAGDTATTFCQELVLANKDDWRLPTKDELETLFSKTEKLQNLSPTIYWSSTQKKGFGFSHLYAWVTNFEYKKSYTRGKLSHYNVRCVRNESEK